MGLLRLLTNRQVLQSGVHSIRQAWEVWNELVEDKRIFFESEPPGLEPVWKAFMNDPEVGPSSWTDAYLASFAIQCDFDMVTFDRGFRRWRNLNTNLLPTAAP